jgi:DNA-binding GntR family transcriptional regulator
VGFTEAEKIERQQYLARSASAAAICDAKHCWHHKDFRATAARLSRRPLLSPLVRSIALALSFLVIFEYWTTAASASVRTVANETGIALSIEGDGSFEVTSRVPAWQLHG